MPHLVILGNLHFVVKIHDQEIEQKSVFFAIDTFPNQTRRGIF